MPLNAPLKASDVTEDKLLIIWRMTKATADGAPATDVTHLRRFDQTSETAPIESFSLGWSSLNICSRIVTLAFLLLNVWACSLTCPEDCCVFHSSSWRAALERPGRGNRGAAGRGCPVVGAPPGWMPFPAGWKRSGYTLRCLEEFALGEVWKLNKKSVPRAQWLMCKSQGVMTHTRTQIQWSFWRFLYEWVALLVRKHW